MDDLNSSETRDLSPAMNQTILALAATLIFSIFALGQVRGEAHDERGMNAMQMEIAAKRLAVERLSTVSSLAFDEEDTRPGAGTRIRFEPPSSPIGRDGGERTYSHFDDIDDVHGWTQRSLTVLNKRDIVFRDSFFVRYVDPFAPDDILATTERTLAKEVCVKVEEVGDTPGRPAVQVTFCRLITPTGQDMLR